MNEDGAERQLIKYQNTADDEISLIEIAKILIIRWKLMSFIFLIVVGSALVYALLLDRPYEYVSTYKVAEQAPLSGNSQVGLESPNTIVAKINNLYLGPVVREVLNDFDLEALPLDTRVSTPRDTLLVHLMSVANQSNSELVEVVHKQLFHRVQADQAELLQRRQNVLEAQLVSAKNSLELASESTSPTSAELVATYSTRVSDIEDQLAQLREGEVIQMSVRSLEQVGTSRSLIMVGAMAFGLIIAILAAFISHFISLVRESFNAEKVN